jgi:hypothetical protein
MRAALRDAWRELGHDTILVHGAAPGADTMAAEIWTRGGLSVEAHPADWDRPCDTSCYHRPREKNGRSYCPLAGHYRNQHMVDLGADLLLAFPMPGSRGTWDCLRRAKVAEIPRRIVYSPGSEK